MLRSTEVSLRPVDKLFVAIKGAVVYQGKLLLLQESGQYIDGVRQGKWDLPGGRVHPGESWSDALVREVREETGLSVTLGRPYFIGEWWPEPRGERWQVVATCVVCEAETDQVSLSDDHQAYRWIDPKPSNDEIDYAPCIEAAVAAYYKLVT